MSKVTNKQIADVYRECKNKMDVSGGWKFICNVIIDRVSAGEVVRGCAKDVITRRLQGCYTLEDWLHRNRIATYKITTNDVNRMYNYRLAWLDSLIAEFDKPGYYEQ